tara:strand:+ start:172 stop:489 length:318 start_codon:yes stop_codon:yes gene_type:complete
VWGWVVRKQCNTGTLGVFSELYYCDTKVVAFKYRKDIMMTMINRLKTELSTLLTDLSQQIEGYERLPVGTSDERITQGWLEAVEYIDKHIQRLEEDEQQEDFDNG